MCDLFLDQIGEGMKYDLKNTDISLELCRIHHFLFQWCHSWGHTRTLINMFNVLLIVVSKTILNYIYVSINLLLCVLVCGYLCVDVGMVAARSMCGGPRITCGRLVSPFFHVGSRNQTQVVQFGGMHL